MLSEVLTDAATAYAEVLADKADLDAAFATGMADFAAAQADLAAAISEAQADATAAVDEIKLQAQSARDQAEAQIDLAFFNLRQEAAADLNQITVMILQLQDGQIASIEAMRKAGDEGFAAAADIVANVNDALANADEAMTDEKAGLEGKINDAITARERLYREVHKALTGETVAGMGGIPEGPGPYKNWLMWALGEGIVRPELGDDFLINASDEELDAAAVYLGVKYGLIIRFAPSSGGGYWGSVRAGAVFNGTNYLANRTMMSIISQGRTSGPTVEGFATATAWGGAFGAVGFAAAPHINKAGSWLGNQVSKVTAPVQAVVAKTFNAAKNRILGWFGRAGDRTAPNLVGELLLSPEAQRALLREAMESNGTGKRAHHLIPLEALSEFRGLMERGARGEFNLNGANNGVLLAPLDHYGSHPIYNRMVLDELGRIEGLSRHLTDSEIAALLQKTADTLRGILDDGSWLPLL